MPEGAIYSPVEAPKGELAFILWTFDQFWSSWRCHLRSPGFFHLSGIQKVAKNLSIADIVAIIGTMDLVFGEVDR